MLLEDVPGTAKTVLARAIAGQRRGRGVRAHPVHARPPADRRHRPLRLQPARPRLRVPARARVRERPPRRRDQPRDAEDAVGAARGDGRAPGDDRRRHARAPRAVPRARDREPDRAGGDVPAPRGAARPLLPAHRARLPGARTTSSRSSRSSSASIRSTGCGPCSRSTEVHVLREAAAATSTSIPSSAAGSIQLVRATRAADGVAIGASVRGSLALERAARAWALLDGRDYVTPVDVERLFLPVVMHRIVFTPSYVATAREIGWQAAADGFRRSASRSRRGPESSSSKRSPHEERGRRAGVRALRSGNERRSDERRQRHDVRPPVRQREQGARARPQRADLERRRRRARDNPRTRVPPLGLLPAARDADHRRRRVARGEPAAAAGPVGGDQVGNDDPGAVEGRTERAIPLPRAADAVPPRVQAGRGDSASEPVAAEPQARRQDGQAPALPRECLEAVPAGPLEIQADARRRGVQPRGESSRWSEGSSCGRSSPRRARDPATWPGRRSPSGHEAASPSPSSS